MQRPLSCAARAIRRAAWLSAAWSALACAQTGGAAEADRVAYVAESGGAFELRFWNAATRRSEVVDIMVDAPALLVWNPPQRTVASIRADGIYQVGYARAPYASDWRGEAPPKGVELVDGWATAGDTIAVVAASAGPGGSTQCTLYDAPRKGAWVKRAEQADAAAPGQAACVAFADARRGSTRSVSSARLMRRYQCAGGHAACAHPDRAALPAAVKDGLLKGQTQLDAIAALDPGDTANLVLAGIASGDTPHFHQPLHLLPRTGGTPTKIDLTAGPQLQLGLQRRLLLAAGEYSGESPAVIDIAAGKVVFQAQGRSATWVPR
jgi:hypothetical protein